MRLNTPVFGVSARINFVAEFKDGGILGVCLKISSANARAGLFQALISSCPELAVLANPDAAFEKCDFQMPFISKAFRFEMSAHPCAEPVPVQNTRILDRY